MVINGRRLSKLILAENTVNHMHNVVRSVDYFYTNNFLLSCTKEKKKIEVYIVTMNVLWL